jgi:hypothetical protein
MNPNKTAELLDNINARLTESATLSRIAFIDLMAAGNDTSSKIHDIYDRIKSIGESMACDNDAA